MAATETGIDQKTLKSLRDTSTIMKRELKNECLPSVVSNYLLIKDNINALYGKIDPNSFIGMMVKSILDLEDVVLDNNIKCSDENKKSCIFNLVLLLRIICYFSSQKLAVTSMTTYINGTYKLINDPTCDKQKHQCQILFVLPDEATTNNIITNNSCNLRVTVLI